MLHEDLVVAAHSPLSPRELDKYPHLVGRVLCNEHKWTELMRVNPSKSGVSVKFIAIQMHRYARTLIIISYLLLNRNRSQNEYGKIIAFAQIYSDSIRSHMTILLGMHIWSALDRLSLAAANHETIWCDLIFFRCWPKFFFPRKDLMTRDCSDECNLLFLAGRIQMSDAPNCVHNDVWEQKAMDNNNNKIISENNVDWCERRLEWMRAKRNEETKYVECDTENERKAEKICHRSV